jgi:hypothetical protein
MHNRFSRIRFNECKEQGKKRSISFRVGTLGTKMFVLFYVLGFLFINSCSSLILQDLHRRVQAEQRDYINFARKQSRLKSIDYELMNPMCRLYIEAVLKVSYYTSVPIHELCTKTTFYSYRSSVFHAVLFVYIFSELSK